MHRENETLANLLIQAQDGRETQDGLEAQDGLNVQDGLEAQYGLEAQDGLKVQDGLQARDGLEAQVGLVIAIEQQMIDKCWDFGPGSVLEYWNKKHPDFAPALKKSLKEKYFECWFCPSPEEVT